MSRDLSTGAQTAMFANETDEAYIVLITLSHPSLITPIYVSSDKVNTVSRGITFVAFPFTITLPTDDTNGPPKAQLAIDNVARDITDAVRQLTDPANITIEIVRSPAPDTVEATFYDFQLSTVKGDAFTLTGDLTVEDISTQTFPAPIFSPARFPGLV